MLQPPFTFKTGRTYDFEQEIFCAEVESSDLDQSKRRFSCIDASRKMKFIVVVDDPLKMPQAELNRIILDYYDSGNYRNGHNQNNM